ncbi:MAG: 16S rRNA (cytidine(1402)-2'-O)-methyltransferase [Verrucomicrobia bacterium]|nr:MAG: 16S rRNA (cytidine(1402)-2'-O)-methyltransferase [Verrucomicrobiota bacterium]
MWHSAGMEAGLYLVGTPIGNLGDITLRALETLKTAGVIVAEDTRQTHKLLERYEIRTPLVSCHKFNEAARVELIIEKIRAGQAVALVTDAGMPAVSDPGSRVVSAIRAAGHLVTVIPGPCSVTSAIALSGFGGSGFLFEGFLTRGSNARKQRLRELAVLDRPVVIFESPYRLLKLLGEMDEALHDRTLFIGRELTKHFEESLLGTPNELIAKFQGRAVKGELVLVIPPPTRAERRQMAEDPEVLSVGGADGN